MAAIVTNRGQGRSYGEIQNGYSVLLMLEAVELSRGDNEILLVAVFE